MAIGGALLLAVIFIAVFAPYLGTVDWSREAAPFRARVLERLEQGLGLTDLRRSIAVERMVTPEDSSQRLMSSRNAAGAVELGRTAIVPGRRGSRA